MIYLISDYLVEGIQSTTISKAWDDLWKESIIGIDTETTGLDPYLSEVVMLQIGTLENQYIIDTRKRDLYYLIDILEGDRYTKVGHNLKFDYSFILKQFGINLTMLYDTMVTECVLRAGRKGIKFGLDVLCNFYNINIFQNNEKRDLRKQFLHIGDKPFTKEQVLYGANDIIASLKVREAQLPIIKDLQLEKTVELENDFVPVLANIEFNGIGVDKEKLESLCKIYENRLIIARLLLNEYIFNHPKLSKYISNQLDMFSDKKKCTVCWSSPKDVIEVLNTLGVSTEVVDKYTGKKKNSCEASHLKKFEKGFDFISPYLNYKELEKLVSTYGENLIRRIHPVTNRLHSDFWQVVSTGRVSSRDPNLQNLPNDKDMRSCFIAAPGYKLIICDYRQQEPSILADKSQDETLLKFFKDGEGDIHSLIASRMYTIINGKETIVTKTNENKHLRAHGKTLGLGMDYGKTAYTIQYDLDVSKVEAQKFVDAYWTSFPGKRHYFDKEISKALKNGYILIEDVINRIMWISDYTEFKFLSNKNFKALTKEERSKYFRIKGNIERAAQNSPIQGTAASMTKYALILIQKEIVEEGWSEDVKIVNICHDEIITECTEEIVEKASYMIQNCMIIAGEYFCKTVPIKVDPIISNYWEKG